MTAVKDSPDPIRCPHLKKAVRVPNMKRAFKKGGREICESCSDSEEKEIWVCISCGITLCGRISNGHAQDHYNDENHPIVFSIPQSAAWCYQCDGWIVPSNSRNRSLYQVKSAVDKQFRKINSLEIYPEKEAKKSNLRIISPGLENLGNTCYFNSTIQVLAACTPLYNILSQKPTQISPSPVSSAFSSLLTSIYSSKSSDPISPLPLLQQIAHRIPRFHVNDQQDAQELLRHLLEALSEENAPKSDSAKKVLKRRRTITNADDITKQGNAGRVKRWLEDTFYGQLASIVVCDECKSVSTSYEDFGDLSLPIRAPSPSLLSKKRDKLLLFVSSTHSFRSRTSTPVNSDSEHSPRVSVESESAPKPISEERREFIKRLLEEKGGSCKAGIDECLKNFFAVETLDGENMFACEECAKQPLVGSDMDTEMKSPSLPPSSLNGSETESDYQPSDASIEDRVSKPFSEPESIVTIPSTPPLQDQPKTVPRKAYKRFLLSSLPLVFIVHLKRFEHTTRAFRKISDAVSFSETLDLSPYVLNLNGTAEYKLVGIVVHMGNLSSGHYVAYMLTRKVLDETAGRETREWIYASDTKVRFAGKEEVLQASKGAYLLFYEKCGIDVH